MCQIARPEQLAPRSSTEDRPVPVLLETPPVDMSEGEYRQCVAGCFDRLKNRAARIAWAHGWDRLDAEDLAQETCLAMLRTRGTRAAALAFRHCLSRTLRCVMYTALSRAYVRRPVPTLTDCEAADGRRPDPRDSGADPAELAAGRIDPPLPAAVGRAVRRLPRSHRRVVEAFLGGGGQFRGRAEAAGMRAHLRAAVRGIQARLAVPITRPRGKGAVPAYTVAEHSRGGRSSHQPAFCRANGKQVYLGRAHSPESLAYFAAVSDAVRAGRPIPRRDSEPGFLAPAD